MIKVIKLLENKPEDVATLYELENGSALTFSGLVDDDSSYEGIINWLEENGAPMIDKTFYVFKGEMMNRIYDLKGKVRYPEDLTFISIKLDSIKNLDRIYLKRYELGGRWLDDIVDNDVAHSKQYKGRE